MTGTVGFFTADAGVVVTMRGRPVTVVGFTVAGGRIAEIDAIRPGTRPQHHRGHPGGG